MPIGFWAISRNDVKEMIQARTGTTPAIWYLDKLCRRLAMKLDFTLDNEIEKVAKEITEENATIA